VSCEIELTLANTHTNKTTPRQQFSYLASQLTNQPRILLVPRFIFYVYNIIMSLTSVRYALFSHCNWLGDRALRWTCAKHFDTSNVLLTNTHNVYTRSTWQRIINILMPAELFQYTTIKYSQNKNDVQIQSHLIARVVFNISLISKLIQLYASLIEIPQW